MKVSLAFAMMLAVCFSVGVADAGMLIADAVGSGNGEQDITGFTVVGLRPDGVTDIAVNRNDNGRALIGSSEIGSTLTSREWQTRRVSYPGNNPAYGWDGSNRPPIGLPGGPGNGGDPYIFVNSGVIDVDSAVFQADIQAGDMITVSFELSSFGNSRATAVLDLGDGAEVHTFALATQVENLHGSLDSSPTGMFEFTDSYTVTGNHSSGQLRIELDTLASGNQTIIDNINLETTGSDATGRTFFPIPEPGTLLLASFGVACGVLRRRS